jgi:asparagine synthase (glutamine-hydrolysing)
VAQAVRDAGFKVLLTGEGADEVFGGYPSQEEAARMWRFREWHARVLPNVAPLRRLGQWLQALAPFDLQALSQEPFVRRGDWEKAPYGSDLVIDAGMRRHRARTLFERFAAVPRLGDRAFLARACDDLYHHLRVLLQTNDKVMMAASIEARVPFLENAVLDLGLHLPPDAKRGGGQSKRTLKAAAAGLLPPDIIHARKIGFAIPNRFQAGYTPILPGGIVADLFKWGAREQAHREGQLVARPFVGEKLVRLELWAQTHLNGASPESLAERMHALRDRPASVGKS